MTEGEFGVVRYLKGIQDGIVQVYQSRELADTVAEILTGSHPECEYRVVEYSRVP